jgi:hypothetical protein
VNIPPEGGIALLSWARKLPFALRKISAATVHGTPSQAVIVPICRVLAGFATKVHEQTEFGL